MAIIIPNLKSPHLNTTFGERRFAGLAGSLLDEDWWCFYNVPVGKLRRYPDFILLHPRYGLLFLEVKDWFLTSIKHICHDTVQLNTPSGLKTVTNPLKQAREGAFQAINILQSDAKLKERNGKHKGHLIFPFGYGVVLSNITRKQITDFLATHDQSQQLIPSHLLICRDELTDKIPSAAFEKHLSHMLPYSFRPLTMPDLNRIRWHLYPEIRIENLELFPKTLPAQNSFPDTIRVMDIHQEQLARALGDGHRIIHGVTGSGKTLILTYRAEVLVKLLNKPILVLCFNITLAAKLRSHFRSRCIADKVFVYHFHDWCSEQLKLHKLDIDYGDNPYWERQVATVIDGVSKGLIPSEQYGAVLLDEGHDFEEPWLRLLVHMIDRKTNSLLLLYDDAQSIYRRTKPRFSFSSVGIQARGRTKILNLNYRNTRQILHFAYEFAKDFLQDKPSDDDQIPLIKPHPGGANGPTPIFKQCPSFQDEVSLATATVTNWRAEGISFSEIAIIYSARWMGKALAQGFHHQRLPFQLLDTSASKRNYDPQTDQVLLVTQHSSKGLEFPRVILIGLGHLRSETEHIIEQTRQTYVAITRAREHLLITASQSNIYTQRIQSITPHRS